MYTIGIDEELKLQLLHQSRCSGFKNEDLPAYVRAVLRNYCNEAEHAEALENGTVEFNLE